MYTTTEINIVPSITTSTIATSTTTSTDGLIITSTDIDATDISSLQDAASAMSEVIINTSADTELYPTEITKIETSIKNANEATIKSTYVTIITDFNTNLITDISTISISTTKKIITTTQSVTSIFEINPTSMNNTSATIQPIMSTKTDTFTANDDNDNALNMSLAKNITTSSVKEISSQSTSTTAKKNITTTQSVTSIFEINFTNMKKTDISFQPISNTTITLQPNMSSKITSVNIINNDDLILNISMTKNTTNKTTTSSVKELSSQSTSTTTLLSNKLTMTTTQSACQCQNPTVDIQNRAILFNKPNINKRKYLLKVIGIIKIDCNATLTNRKEWSIYEVNKLTGEQKQKINLNPNLNPSVNFAEFVLQPYSLNYGLYKFVYHVTMLVSSKSTYSSQSHTFIQIVESGLIISSLNSRESITGGTIEITRGKNQSIEFNPQLNSYDIDGLIATSDLKFKYYCQVIDSGIAKGYPMLSSNSKIDLAMLKSNLSLKSLLTENTTCFDSLGKFKFVAFKLGLVDRLKIYYS